MGYQGLTTSSATPTSVMKRDGNANVFANNFNSGASVVTAAGTTTTLTAASSRAQHLSGTSSSQTFELPNATTLALGWVFVFENNTGSGTLTIKDGSGSTIASIPGGGAAQVVCYGIGSSGGNWDIQFLIPSNASWGTTTGLDVVGPLYAGTLAQFSVNASGDVTAPEITLGSATAYAVLCGGTDTSHPVQSIVSVGTSGEVLTSNGAGALPTFQAASASGAITTIDGDSGSISPSSGVVTISGDTTGLTTTGSSATMVLGGTLNVGHGGTGAATLTGLLTGNGTSAVTATAITEYNVITGGVSNAPNSVAPSSTAGYALCSNGSSSQPSFQVPLGSSLVLLSSLPASNSASISFTSVITSTYNSYLLTFYNYYPASNGELLLMLFSTDNGSEWISSSYEAGCNYTAYNGTTITSSNSTSQCRLTGAASSSTSEPSASGYLYLQNFQTGGIPSIIGQCNFYSTSASAYVAGTIVGMNSSNTNINAIQLTAASGNISTGTFTLYGIIE